MKNRTSELMAISFCCLTFLLFSFCSQEIAAQNGGNNDVKREIPRSALYELRVNSGFVSGGDYEISGAPGLVQEGEASDAFATELRFSVPVLKLKSGTVSLGAYYNYLNMDFEPRKLFPESSAVRFDNNHHTWGATAAFSYRASLFGKNIIGFANINMECSQYGFERLSGLAAAFIPIKRTERSSFSAGAVLLVNSSSKWPLFPFISYRYKFNDKWDFNFIMSQCHLRYKITRNDKLSMGTSIGGEHFYIKPYHSDLPSVCMVSRSYVRPELVYEHEFTPLVRCNLRVGSVCYLNSRLHSSAGNDRYGEMSHDAAAFFQLSFSYGLNPF